MWLFLCELREAAGEEDGGSGADVAVVFLVAACCMFGVPMGPVWFWVLGGLIVASCLLGVLVEGLGPVCWSVLGGLIALSYLLGVVMLLRWILKRREAREKIQTAQERRTESLQEAQEELLSFKQEHPESDTAVVSSLSLTELSKKLQEGSITPEEALFSFMEKTLALNSEVNCCTEILLESVEQLKTLEAHRDGLLYGVPVSIKENIGYKGHFSSCGLTNNLEKPAEEDSVLVKVLKQQGAIPFVKTNLPQAMISYDCANPIFGETVNPLNPERTPGGSSGGEGALIGGGGSLLGVGTDLGGSVRIPAAFCGVCALKPTAGRLSSKGATAIVRGQKSVRSTVGPLARNVDGLARFMEAVLCEEMFSLDPSVPRLPFNMKVYQSSEPLRIGYMEDDGFTQSTPSMLRSLRETKVLLEKAGHTLVPYRPLKMEYAMFKLVQTGVFADGGTTLLERVSGGPLVSSLAWQVFPYRLPIWLKKTLAFILKPLSIRASATLETLCGVGSVDRMWKQHAAVEDYISETLAYWRTCDIDVLLSPVVGPAYHSNVSGKVPTALSCAILYNLLNFPAGVVPVSTVTAKDEEELMNYQGVYQDVWDRAFRDAVSGGEGLPLAVQCVARPWQEEKCLRFMREVEKLVKESKE